MAPLNPNRASDSNVKKIKQLSSLKIKLCNTENLEEPDGK